MTEPFDVQSQLEAELDSGERIVWQGQGRGLGFSAKTVLPSLFGLVWSGFIFAMIFLGNHGRNAHSTPVSIFVVPLFVGVIFVLLPLLRFAGARRPYYLITNRRALIVTLGSSKKVLTYYPEKLQSLERRERKDGRGDIVIERTAGATAGGYRTVQYLQDVGFMNIPDVKTVEGMLRDLATKGSDPRR